MCAHARGRRGTTLIQIMTYMTGLRESCSRSQRRWLPLSRTPASQPRSRSGSSSSSTAMGSTTRRPLLQRCDRGALHGPIRNPTRPPLEEEKKCAQNEKKKVPEPTGHLFKVSLSQIKSTASINQRTHVCTRPRGVPQPHIEFRMLCTHAHSGSANTTRSPSLSCETSHTKCQSYARTIAACAHTVGMHTYTVKLAVFTTSWVHRVYSFLFTVDL